MTREADIAITYASLATTTAFLLAGKPLLLLPGHLEQFLVARRVEEMGAGRLVNPEQAPGDLRAVLADLIDNPSWRSNAQAFAAKYAAFDQQAVIGNLVRRITEILDSPVQKEGMS
jgi:UDP:flavonoid glycosyltransferase YjiC (YdhE family)